MREMKRLICQQSEPAPRPKTAGLHYLYYQRLRNDIMIETIAVLLIVLWLLGMVSSYTLGGFIHILLVIAVIMLLVRLIQGRRL
jgi:hypothetical protein